jgi:hypothetical protein
MLYFRHPIFILVSELCSATKVVILFMNLKKMLKQRMEKYAASADDQSSRLSHRDAYHKFFEGYSERKVVDSSGRTRIERRYTGAHYRPKLSHKQMLFLRIAYPVLFIAAAVLFVTTAVAETPSNHVWYAALPQACTIPMLVWFLVSYLYYIPIKKELEIGEYNRSSVPLKRSTLIGAGCLLLSAVTAILTLFGYSKGEFLAELSTALRFIICAALLFAIGFTESRIDYERIDSSVDAPPDSVEID